MSAQAFAPDQARFLRFASPRAADFASRVAGDTAQLLGEVLGAFHAFARLPALAEDMRILSLNAELAAGRAGKRGLAVRALTQYTRQLVVRLGGLLAAMGEVKTRSYGASATILRASHLVALLDRAGCGTASADERGRIARAASEVRAAALKLEALVAEIGRVVDQSNSIVIGIATEAATAGHAEAEFRTVAETLRGYVRELGAMMSTAAQGARSARRRIESLAAAVQA